MQTNPLDRAFDAPIHHAANASGIGTVILCIISLFSPSEWMVIGIVIGIFSTLAGLIISVYVRIKSLSLYKSYLLTRTQPDKPPMPEEKLTL